jgi:hypothetical protein
MKAANGWFQGAALGSVIVAAIVAVAASGGAPAPASAATQRAPTAPEQVVVRAPEPNPPTVRQADEPWQNGVTVSLNSVHTSGGRQQTSPGRQFMLKLTVNPVMARQVTIGTSRMLQSMAWNPHEIAEMRTCITTRQPIGPSPTWTPDTCDLPETWEPYVASRDVAIDVNWIGPGEITVLAQFRRADGTVVQAMDSVYKPVESARSQSYADSVIDPNVPVESLPPAVQSLVNAQRAAFPVQGSVKIKGSPCCIGSTTSSTSANVTFAATSPSGEVTEMRLGGGGCNTGTLENVRGAWEPFATQRDVPVSVTLGWSTYNMAVQYRDAAGNLSIVACDSIGVEGMPRRP